MELRVLDTNYIDVQVLDVFRSFIWTDRYSAYGDFEVLLAPTTDNLKFLKEDYYLWSGDSEHTMIIEDIRIITSAEVENQLLVTGRSLESLLERRIIWDQTNLTGNFQNGIKKLIDDSIIAPAGSTRANAATARIPNFIFQASADPAVTALTINQQFTGTNLYEAVKKLCDLHNIGFRVVLSEDNNFVFSLYAGTDRSYNQILNPYVIFAPNFDNLINSNYFSSKREFKTITLVAGEGEGTARVRVEVPIAAGAGTGLNRREMYTDARDLSRNSGQISQEVYLENLRERGRNYLAENAIVKAFEGHVDTLNKFRFGKDFFMGDIVQIANEYGIEATSRVTELVRSLNEEGLEVFPTFTTVE